MANKRIAAVDLVDKEYARCRFSYSAILDGCIILDK
jgi:hypothetical protein